MGDGIETELPFVIIVDGEHRDNASSRVDNAMEIIDPGRPTGVCFERASSRTAVANNDDRTNGLAGRAFCCSTTVATASSTTTNRIIQTGAHVRDNRLLPKHETRIRLTCVSYYNTTRPRHETISFESARIAHCFDAAVAVIWVKATG